MVKRIILAILIFVFAFVLVSSIISYRSLRKSLPQTKGTITASPLKEPVHLFRDQYGVPHIFAQNDHDLYFALGYVMAQDRIWQLETLRRAVNGRLSEVMGDTTVALDRLFLTVGFKRLAGEFYNRLSETSKAMIRAYVDGINTYIKSNKDKIPVEMMLLNMKPELWHAEDCLAASRLIAWRLSIAWYVELVAERLKEQLGMNKASQLMGDYAAHWPVTVHQSECRWEMQALFDIVNQMQNIFGSPQWSLGSNNWVVSGKKTATGKPLLANDPHLILTNPSQWYMVHLHAPGVDVAGFTLPGSPAVVIGWNDRIAWGFTNVMADDADFFVERIHSQDSTLYWRGDGWKRLREIQETIPVLGGETRRFSVWLTDHGPIIDQVHPQAKKSKKRLSYRWTGQDFSDEFLAFYKLNRAKNWHDFKDAVRLFKVPAQNVVYADIEGNIGYWCAGAIPIRVRKNGIFPGTSYDWQGTIPFNLLPHAFNPRQGFIATANNKLTTSDYPYYISTLWEPPSRITRIREVLQNGNDFNVEDMKALQVDVLSPFARFLMPYILPELKMLADKDEKFRRVFQFMQGWDYQMRGESVAAAIFQMFVHRFIQNIFQDDIQDEDLLTDFFYIPNLSLKELRLILENNRDYWFDDITTENQKETRSDIIKRSWLEAVQDLENQLGGDLIKWRWDQLHRVTFRHFLGDLPLMGKFLNVGPFPLGGSYTTVNNGTFNFNKPFDCVIGPSMRMIVDFSRPRQAQVVCPPGQVGHPLSKHYRNQVNLWLNGLYWTFETDSTLIFRSDFEQLTLEPELAQ